MQYSVRGSDGNTYGPVDLMTLKQWVQEGRVQPTNQVTDNLSNRTLQASQMPELGMTIAANPYLNAPAPPQNFSSYPRTGEQPVHSHKTHLWGILVWLCIAFLISLFTRTGGLISSGLTIMDAFRAKSQNDRYATLCMVFAISGFTLILIWTYMKSKLGLS